MPAAQVAQVEQLSALLDVLNEPPAQVVQARSSVSEGMVVTYVPEAQVAHVVQLFWLLDAVNVPAPQAEHALSSVAEGVVVT